MVETNSAVSKYPLPICSTNPRCEGIAHNSMRMERSCVVGRTERIAASCIILSTGNRSALIARPFLRRRRFQSPVREPIESLQTIVPRVEADSHQGDL